MSKVLENHLVDAMEMLQTRLRVRLGQQESKYAGPDELTDEQRFVLEEKLELVTILLDTARGATVCEDR